MNLDCPNNVNFRAVISGRLVQGIIIHESGTSFLLFNDLSAGWDINTCRRELAVYGYSNGWQYTGSEDIEWWVGEEKERDKSCEIDMIGIEKLMKK